MVSGHSTGQTGNSPTDKEQLLKRIITALKSGTLELPSLPDIALDVRVAANQDNLNIEDLARLVQQDPGLSAYLLKVSISSYYKRRHATNNLGSALRRLGLNATRDLTASYALKTLFCINSAQIKRRLREIWQRSVYTAALAHVMARHCGFDPDRALLAGLLQDIGALPILANLKEYPALLDDQVAIDDLLNNYTGKISALVLNHWQFDHELVAVGLERGNWLRDKPGPADLADLVLVARYHSYLGEPSHKTLPQLSTLPAFQKLKLGEIGPQQGLAFLREAQQEIDELRSALL
jgi:HD-like signal output (HDOD) protein